MSLAFVFPGQGSQKAGMGKALAEAFAESRAAYAGADAASSDAVCGAHAPASSLFTASVSAGTTSNRSPTSP